MRERSPGAGEPAGFQLASQGSGDFMELAGAEIMSKGNPGVSKLLNSMKKLIREVNDKEICNRLEILMGVEREDIPPHLIRALFDDPFNFNADQIPEPFSQYVRHYLYMLKRDQRIQDRERLEKEKKKGSRANSGAKKTSRSRNPSEQSA
jgi:hypothetical protein